MKIAYILKLFLVYFLLLTANFQKTCNIPQSQIIQPPITLQDGSTVIQNHQGYGKVYSVPTGGTLKIGHLNIGTNEYSIDFYVNFQSLDISKWTLLFTLAQNISGQQSLQFGYMNGQYILKIRTKNPNAEEYPIVESKVSKPIDLNQWIHYTVNVGQNSVQVRVGTEQIISLPFTFEAGTKYEKNVIGTTEANGEKFLNAYVKNFRVVKRKQRFSEIDCMKLLCKHSNPDRIGKECECPSNYYDNQKDDQCQPCNEADNTFCPFCFENGQQYQYVLDSCIKRKCLLQNNLLANLKLELTMKQDDDGEFSNSNLYTIIATLGEKIEEECIGIWISDPDGAEITNFTVQGKVIRFPYEFNEDKGTQCKRDEDEHKIYYDCTFGLGFSFQNEFSKLDYDAVVKLVYPRKNSAQNKKKYYNFISFDEKKSVSGKFVHAIKSFLNVMDDENFLNERDTNNPVRLGSNVYLQLKAEEQDIVDGRLEFYRAFIKDSKGNDVEIKPTKVERFRDNILNLTFQPEDIGTKLCMEVEALLENKLNGERRILSQSTQGFLSRP